MPVLDYAIDLYTGAFFEEGRNIRMQEAEIKMMRDKEKQKIRDLIRDAIDDIKYELEEQMQKDMLKNLTAARDMLNEKLYINVYVNDDDGVVPGVTTRVIVKKDQKLWEGKTDNGGCWNLTCTNLGYMCYQCPGSVEIEYDGEKYTQNFTIGFKGATLHFQVHKKSKESSECDPLKGVYKGKIFFDEGKTPFEGPLEITITDKNSMKATANYTIKTSSQCADITHETKIECTGKLINYDNRCVMFFEGNAHHKIIEIGKCRGESSGTKEIDGKYIMQGILEGNKIIQYKTKGVKFEVTKQE